MPIVTIKAEDLRNPFDSNETNVSIEDAPDCDGSVCGNVCADTDGHKVSPGPHFHIVLIGKKPQTSPRRYLV